MEAQIQVKNWQQLIDRLNTFSQVTKNKAILEGLIAGANLINSRARASLEANKKGASKTGYSYYQSIFKYEQTKGQELDMTGVRTGVWDRKNGYKLRWLEWGTDDRFTFKRFNPALQKSIPEQFRGRIEGNGYFFNAVRNSDDEVFKIVSEAVIKELEKHWREDAAYVDYLNG